MMINGNEELAFKCSLKNFDGPLDVLWMLIRKKKESIQDLDIVELANQYVKFIESAINDVSVDEFSEYTLMSAYLIELKARSLLPNPNNLNLNARNLNAERENLIQRLLDYQMYKNMVPLLKEALYERDKMWEKLPEDYDEFFMAEIPMGKLPRSISAQKLKRFFENAVRLGVERSLIFKKVELPQISITDVQKDLIHQLELNNGYLVLTEFFAHLPSEKKTVEYFCLLFLSMLILIKRHWIQLEDLAMEQDFRVLLLENHGFENLEMLNQEDLG